VKLLSVQEDERKRIAAELHDTIGSCLSAAKFKVGEALNRMLAVAIFGCALGAGAAWAGSDPKALCDAAKGAGIEGPDLYWAAASDNPDYFFCTGTKHDFPGGGGGNILMFTYQVYGDASGAKTIAVVASIYDDKLPTEAIGRTLQPLLLGIFSAAGKGPVPGDLAQNVASISEFRTDTPLGAASASYKPSDQSDNPYNGAKYAIRIDLQ
jgi:hypothetical protein